MRLSIKKFLSIQSFCVLTERVCENVIFSVSSVGNIKWLKTRGYYKINLINIFELVVNT